MITFLWVLLGVIVAWSVYTNNFGKIMVVLKGLTNIFTDSVFKTKEGVQATFQEAINKETEILNEFKSRLIDFSKDRVEIEHNIEKEEKNIVDYTAQCKLLISDKKDNDARALALIIQQCTVRLEAQKNALPMVTEKMEEIKKYISNSEQNIIALREEMKTTLSNMKLNESIVKVNNKFSNLNSQDIDKLLNVAREHSNNLKFEARGSEIIKESMVSTQISRAADAINTQNADKFIEDLKKTMKVKK